MAARERPLPDSEDAQIALIGMLDGTWGDVLAEADALRSAEFHVESWRTVWQAAQAVRADDAPVNFLSIHDKLKEWDVIGAGKPIESIGQVTACANDIPPNATPRQLAESIQRTALRRWDIKRAAALTDAAYRATDEEWQHEREEASAYLSSGPPAEASGSKRRLYPLLTDLEVEAFTPAQGILGDLLFEDSIAYLFADSDTWKTFVAVSWCLCIATGTSWLGRKVRQGPAIYVPAEGARGLGKRITAWKQHHGFAGQSVDFLVVPMAVNLLDRQAVPTLIEDIKAHPRLAGRVPQVIVFDTVASSMDGGDENDTKDANRITAATRSLKQAFGCNVLLLHHSGNAYTHRMRGNSAFRANADTVIRVKAPELPDGQKRLPGDVVTLCSVKAKDDAGFDDIHCTTELEEWTREDGMPASSLVVVATDKVPAKRGELVIMPPSSRTALEKLAKLETTPTASEWHLVSGLAKRTFYDARDDLANRQYVESDAEPGTKGAHYALTEAGRKVLGAKVQDGCENGATALPDTQADGADDGSAPIRANGVTKPQLMRVGDGAADGGTIYTFAPSHQSPNGNRTLAKKIAAAVGAEDEI